MSHFFTVVLISEEQLDSEKQGIIDKLMEPYSELLKVEPYRKYLDADDIAGGVRSYGSEQALIENMEDWEGEGHTGGMDLRGIYYMTTRNTKSKHDGFRVGGRYDGRVTANPQSSENGFNFDPKHQTLENNSARVKDLPENFKCFAIVTPDGEWHDKEEFGSFFGPIPEWDRKMLDILSQHSDCLAVGLDCHI